MMKVIFRRSCSKLLLAWTLCVTILFFYAEVYKYYANSAKWTQIACKKSEKTCLRILLVADPQLIGQNNEIIHPFTPFTIWDSDRYLVKTFQYAFTFAKPDVVIFLGDLFDEGSQASDDEFFSYARRLFNIFLGEPYSNVKHIWLPGDNDIGGEGNDQVTPLKLKRFYRTFSQPDTIAIKNVNFYKINRIIQNVPVIKEKKEFFDTSKISVGLSHIPLMFIPSVFVDKVLTKMQPHLLFTAHEHKSMIISTDAVARSDRHIVPVTPDDNKIFEYALGAADMYEIVVPTCSYRMGETKIGYGFAVIEQDELRYTVLWSPTRFPMLLIYGGFLCLLFWIVIINVCKQLRRKKRSS